MRGRQVKDLDLIGSSNPALAQTERTHPRQQSYDGLISHQQKGNPTKDCTGRYPPPLHSTTKGAATIVGGRSSSSKKGGSQGPLPPSLPPSPSSYTFRPPVICPRSLGLPWGSAIWDWEWLALGNGTQCPEEEPRGWRVVDVSAQRPPIQWPVGVQGTLACCLVVWRESGTNFLDCDLFLCFVTLLISLS